MVLKGLPCRLSHLWPHRSLGTLGRVPRLCVKETHWLILKCQSGDWAGRRHLSPSALRKPMGAFFFVFVLSSRCHLPCSPLVSCQAGKLVDTIFSFPLFPFLSFFSKCHLCTRSLCSLLVFQCLPEGEVLHTSCAPQYHSGDCP